MWRTCTGCAISVACLLMMSQAGGPALQDLIHEGAAASGQQPILSKLTSLADLHKAFGMQYKVEHQSSSWIEEVRPVTK